LAERGRPDFLKPIHGDVVLANLRIILKKGMAGFLKGEKR